MILVDPMQALLSPDWKRHKILPHPQGKKLLNSFKKWSHSMKISSAPVTGFWV